MPVHHLVYFRFKESSCTAELASQIHGDIPNTLLKIPGVTHATFGKNIAPASSSRNRSDGFTHMLTVKFESRRAFEGWAPHPMHKKWGTDWIGPNLDGPATESIRKIDVDVDGPVKKHTAQHVVFLDLENFSAQDEQNARDDIATTLLLIEGVTDCAFAKASS